MIAGAHRWRVAIRRRLTRREGAGFVSVVLTSLAAVLVLGVLVHATARSQASSRPPFGQFFDPQAPPVMRRGPMESLRHAPGGVHGPCTGRQSKDNHAELWSRPHFELSGEARRSAARAPSLPLDYRGSVDMGLEEECDSQRGCRTSSRRGQAGCAEFVSQRGGAEPQRLLTRPTRQARGGILPPATYPSPARK